MLGHDLLMLKHQPITTMYSAEEAFVKSLLVLVMLTPRAYYGRWSCTRRDDHGDGDKTAVSYCVGVMSGSYIIMNSMIHI